MCPCQTVLQVSHLHMKFFQHLSTRLEEECSKKQHDDSSHLRQTSWLERKLQKTNQQSAVSVKTYCVSKLSKHTTEMPKRILHTVPSIGQVSQNSRTLWIFARIRPRRVKHEARTINPEILHAQTFKLHASGKAKAQSKSAAVAASCWKLRTPKRTTCSR